MYERKACCKEGIVRFSLLPYLIRCRLTRQLSGDLTTDERDDYVKSVLCLMSAPSKLSSTKYPGAKSRYDDFVVIHMNMTPTVHGTVSLPPSGVHQGSS